MTEEKVYNLLCAYSRKQLGSSVVVANDYDYMDLAHACYVRYLRGDWNMEYPVTYLWMVVSSTLKNLHSRDKLRSYKERPQHKVKSVSHDGSSWLSEDEDEWNNNFVAEGPEEYCSNMETIECASRWSERAKYIKPNILYRVASGEYHSRIIKDAGIPNKLFYKDLQKLKRHASIRGMI